MSVEAGIAMGPSRESVLDQAIARLIAKLVHGEASSKDVEMIQDLSAERATRLRPPSVERVRNARLARAR